MSEFAVTGANNSRRQADPELVLNLHFRSNNSPSGVWSCNAILDEPLGGHSLRGCCPPRTRCPCAKRKRLRRKQKFQFQRRVARILAIRARSARGPVKYPLTIAKYGSPDECRTPTSTVSASMPKCCCVSFAYEIRLCFPDE